MVNANKIEHSHLIETTLHITAATAKASPTVVELEQEDPKDFAEILFKYIEGKGVKLKVEELDQK